MMRKPDYFVHFALAALLVFSFGFVKMAQASAQDDHRPSPQIIIEDAYAPPSPPGIKNGAIFFRARLADNLSESPHPPTRIVGAKSDIAERIELHTHSHENGIMRMRQTDGFTLPATLNPTGDHVMLFGLREQLKDGGHFPLTLEFEHAPSITIQVNIRRP